MYKTNSYVRLHYIESHVFSMKKISGLTLKMMSHRSNRQSIEDDISKIANESNFMKFTSINYHHLKVIKSTVLTTLQRFIATTETQFKQHFSLKLQKDFP